MRTHIVLPATSVDRRCLTGRRNVTHRHKQKHRNTTDTDTGTGTGTDTDTDINTNTDDTDTETETDTHHRQHQQRGDAWPGRAQSSNSLQAPWRNKN